MRYWLDTEFIEDGERIHLLSIGMVAEDGRELYMENAEAPLTATSLWVRRNVLRKMRFEKIVTFSEDTIADRLIDFCDPSVYGKPEFWAYYADYDWVVVCQLFGLMIDLPEGWPQYCLDFKQWLVMNDNPPLIKMGDDMQHNALADARWLSEEFFRLGADSSTMR